MSSKMKRFLFCLSLLCAPVAQAGPKHFAKSIGSQLKRTFYSDVKAHPLAWGLNLGLQFGIAYADTATSCRLAGSNVFYETGPAHFFVGKEPSCHKFLVLTTTAMTIHAASENWLANIFKESCDREAANPESRWWRTPSHTKSTAACYWALPLADTLALAAYEIPIIKHNAELK